MTSDIRKLSRVTAEPGFVLVFEVEGERETRRADLSGLVARSRFFRLLADEPDAFAKVETVLHGSGVQWPVETEFGELDLSADTLIRLANEQRPMTGADFAAWRAELGLSLASAAETLGVSRRTIVDYEKREQLPTVVAIACRTLSRDDTVLSAHYHGPKSTGRPKKAA